MESRTFVRNGAGTVVFHLKMAAANHRVIQMLVPPIRRVMRALRARPVIMIATAPIHSLASVDSAAQPIASTNVAAILNVRRVLVALIKTAQAACAQAAFRLEMLAPSIFNALWLVFVSKNDTDSRTAIAHNIVALKGCHVQAMQSVDRLVMTSCVWMGA